MSKLPKNVKTKSRSEAILDHLYSFIEETKEVETDEEKDDQEIVYDETLVLLQVAASLSAHVIRETGKLGLDEASFYEDYIGLVDLYIDLEEEKDENPPKKSRNNKTKGFLE